MSVAIGVFFIGGERVDGNRVVLTRRSSAVVRDAHEDRDFREAVESNLRLLVAIEQSERSPRISSRSHYPGSPLLVGSRKRGRLLSTNALLRLATISRSRTAH